MIRMPIHQNTKSPAKKPGGFRKYNFVISQSGRCTPLLYSEVNTNLTIDARGFRVLIRLYGARLRANGKAERRVKSGACVARWLQPASASR
jgi:hypothetical protein